MWVDKNVFLELIIWEDFLDALSPTRKQDDYNKAICECDLFVMLFATKVGKYTEEEFETAFQQFKATSKPLIFTYFKDTPPSTARIEPVTQEESSEAKYKIAFATSSTVPTLPNGCCEAEIFLPDSEDNQCFRAMSVSTTAGHTQLNRILYFAYSIAQAFVR